MIWRKHPNGGRVATVSVPTADANQILQRGWLSVNGSRATAEFIESERGDRTALRISFAIPYPFPHP